MRDLLDDRIEPMSLFVLGMQHYPYTMESNGRWTSSPSTTFKPFEVYFFIEVRGCPGSSYGGRGAIVMDSCGVVGWISSCVGYLL